MALPQLTPEQRQAALDKAAASRRERVEVKNRLKNSGASILDVLREGQTNEVIGKMKVIDLLQAIENRSQIDFILCRIPHVVDAQHDYRFDARFTDPLWRRQFREIGVRIVEVRVLIEVRKRIVVGRA